MPPESSYNVLTVVEIDPKLNFLFFFKAEDGTLHKDIWNATGAPK